MINYVAITTRREFELEAENWHRAVQKATSVLNNEDLIILARKSHVDINYTDGTTKAKR